MTPGRCRMRLHVAEELVLGREEGVVDEVVRLDAGEGDLGRDVLLGHGRDVGDEVRGELLPPVPGEGGLPLDGGVGRVQPAVVGGEDVGLLGFVEDREELRPGVGEDPLRARRRRSRRPRPSGRGRSRGGSGPCSAPGAPRRRRGRGVEPQEPPKTSHFSMPEPLPDPFRVGHEVGGRVLADLPEGRRAAASRAGRRGSPARTTGRRSGGGAGRSRRRDRRGRR